MFGSKKEHLCVICDVGSASLSVGVVAFAEKSKPKIVATKTFPISIGPSPDIQNLENRITDFFDKAIFWASHDGLAVAHKQGIRERKIEHVCVVLASPWYVSKTSKVIIEKEKPFELDEDIIQSAVKNEESVFEKEILSGKYEQVKGKDIKMIEREVVAVKLNGYETANPHDKKATHAEFSFFMSVVPASLASSMSTVVKKYFHINNIFFKTFPLCFLGSVKKIYPHENDFILVDVAGESTDVSLVARRTVEDSNAFFHGRNNLVRILMEHFEITEEIALSFISLNQAGTTEPNIKKEVDELMNKDSLAWNSSISKIFDEFHKKGNVPSTCFVVCDEPFSPLFEKRLKEVGLKYGISHVIFLGPEHLLEQVDVLKSAKQDEFLMIETIFFERHGIGFRD